MAAKMGGTPGAMPSPGQAMPAPEPRAPLGLESAGWEPNKGVYLGFTEGFVDFWWGLHVGLHRLIQFIYVPSDDVGGPWHGLPEILAVDVGSYRRSHVVLRHFSKRCACTSCWQTSAWAAIKTWWRRPKIGRVPAPRASAVSQPLPLRAQVSHGLKAPHKGTTGSLVQGYYNTLYYTALYYNVLHYIIPHD